MGKSKGMKKINIFINNQKFEAELNETETAKKIYQTLPIEAEGDFWGNEIYFEIPVKTSNEKPVEYVEIGDLAYWPEGSCLCIFFGRTPVSTDERPKPATDVTVVGKIKGNLEELKKLNQAKIKIEL